MTRANRGAGGVGKRKNGQTLAEVAGTRHWTGSGVVPGAPGRARGGARGAGRPERGLRPASCAGRPLTPGPGGPILPSSTVRAMARHNRLRTGDPKGPRALGGHGRA